MILQSLIVALLVFGCTAFAAWSLLPGAARRGVAAFLLRLPVRRPSRLDGFLRRHAEPSNACGCDGCDRSELKPKAQAPAQAQAQAQSVVRFHPRVPSRPGGD